jgi:hypothetical protein
MRPVVGLFASAPCRPAGSGKSIVLRRRKRLAHRVGERFRPEGLTAAHRTRRMGTRVTVTNLRNGVPSPGVWGSLSSC